MWFWATVVKQFALCCQTVQSVLSCLSVTLVYCGQMVGWIKMKLGTQVVRVRVRVRVPSP